jgi:hypothetical protein
VAPARHEKMASCPCCAASSARSAGTARARTASCRIVLVPIVPVPVRARVGLGWAGQMAMYNHGLKTCGEAGKSLIGTTNHLVGYIPRYTRQCLSIYFQQQTAAVLRQITPFTLFSQKERRSYLSRLMSLE